MGMSKTGSVLKRRAAAAVVFLTLLFLLAIPQPALGSGSVWVDGDGVLRVWYDGDIKINCVNGYVKVNGQDPSGGAVLCTDIKGMVVNGGDGDNKIDLGDVGTENFPNVENVEINGGDGNDEITGSGFDDKIDGGAGNDELFGEKGNDEMHGGDGNDYMRGGDGNDEMHGGEGSDTQIGDSGNDEMYGGDGNDWQYGGSGDDNLNGGSGDDNLNGGSGDDNLNGGPGNDNMRGGPGDDRYAQDPGSADTITDTVGDDTVDFSNATSGITIDMDLQDVDQVVDTAANTVRLEGQLENFIGSGFNDEVFVDPLDVPRSIDGEDGTDTLNFDAQGAPVTDDGTTLTAEGYAPVTYANFETVNITVEAKGNVNGDGTVDILDVRLCLQIALGVIDGTPEQREQADVDSDGDVDLTDAQILAEFIIGIRTSFPGDD